MKRRTRLKQKAKNEKRRRPGQPSLYRVEFSERVHELCLLGLSDSKVAADLGIAESTLNLWKKAHPEFLECYRLGRAAADGKVAKALFLRALGYSHPAVKIFNDEGAPLVVDYVEHYPPDTAAALAWLHNRQPEHWKREPMVAVSASAVANASTTVNGISDEILERMRACAAERAGVKSNG
jgi:hypothetical protein